jgi:hypothetical protein
MRRSIKHLLLIIVFLIVALNVGYGWSRLTHERIAYWAWKYSGLPPTSLFPGDSVLPIVWNLDSVQNTLGLQGCDIQGFLLTFFASVSADNFFDINTKDTVSTSFSDSAIISIWGARPDRYDGPTKALGALFGHMYVPTAGGFADGMCKIFFNKAVREYKAHNRRRAYAYLAMAAHYLADIGFPPHNEKNYLDLHADAWQAAYHGLTEDWIADTANWYNHFDATCDSFARAALPACDPVVAVHGLAWECGWYDQPFKDAAVKADKTEMIAICKKCLRAAVPRVTGLFAAFKQKVL